jgi:hypothetical protein
MAEVSIGRALSAGTRSWRDLAIASRTAASSVRAASAAARLDTAAAATSFFFGFLLRLCAGDDEARAPSRMMRAPLLRPLVGGGDAGSFFTVVLDVDADPDERDANLDADHELPYRRDTEGTAGGGIPRTG